MKIIKREAVPTPWWVRAWECANCHSIIGIQESDQSDSLINLNDGGTLVGNRFEILVWTCPVCQKINRERSDCVPTNAQTRDNDSKPMYTA